MSLKKGSGWLFYRAAPTIIIYTIELTPRGKPRGWGRAATNERGWWERAYSERGLFGVITTGFFAAAVLDETVGYKGLDVALDGF